MKKRTLVLTTTYVFGQTILGLWLHPFQTVRQLVEDKSLKFLVLWPSLILAVLFFLWRGLMWPLATWTAQRILLITQLNNSDITLILLMLNFGKWWVFYFCLIWQFLILTLTIKFELFFRKYL